MFKYKKFNYRLVDKEKFENCYSCSEVKVCSKRLYCRIQSNFVSSYGLCDKYNFIIGFA